MNLLTIRNLKKAYTDKVLFDGIDFSLEEGEKVGIIGINGTGKTTLLRIIAGLEEFDDGEYTKGKQVVINYLPQNPEFDGSRTIYEYVVGENRDEHENFGLEGQAKTILNKLGFDDYDMQLRTLSGGQKKKVALAAALLSQNEILILDEPTNHLDNAMTQWLEEWLHDYRGCLVMVTHDRYFLDLVCNRIDELDKGKLYSYHTNYEGYLALKQEREEMQQSTQKKHANILRKEIAWIQRGARARSTKQKAHIARYEALRDEKKPVEDGTVSVEAIASRIGKKTVEIRNLGKSYGTRRLIEDFTFTFLKNDRIGILGPNGCGKSTLMKMITGSVAPDCGSIEIGETMKIGYYAQDCEEMNPSERVIDYIRDKAEVIRTEDGYITASQMLENFLFDGSAQYSAIGKLSGGERRRLYLARVLMEAPNVLILDEPTNDLDIATLQILEDYLDTFPGIIIAVSHDRYFLDRVVNRMLTFEPGGRILLYNGSYTEYFLDHDTGGVSYQNTAGVKNAEGARAYKEQKEQNKKLKFTYREQKEYETIEDDIAEIEQKIAEIGMQMEDPKLASDYTRLTELSRKKEETEALLEEKMERFLYLSELAEKIEAESGNR